MMKVLFLDSNDEVQKKWVAPLRNEGWGAVRVKSIQDAERMMGIHGEGLDAIIVHENWIGFTEKSSVPFVVLTEKWTEKEIIKHQNSARPALGYIPVSSSVGQLIGLFSRKAAASELKMTGTEGGTSAGARTGIRLQDATGFLTRPEKTKTFATASLVLKAPQFTLGGKAAVVEAPVEVPSDAPEQTRVLEAAADLGEVDLSSLIRSEEAQGIQEPLSIEPVHDSTPEYESVPELDSVPEFDPVPVLRAVPDLRNEVSPDMEALKTYLSMREQDVAVLTGQLRSSKERMQQLESLLKMEEARNAEMQEMLSKAEQKIKNYNLEKQVEIEVLQKQTEDLEAQLKEKTDKARGIETRLKLMSEEVNKVKDRVRVDIRRIRVREKELEGQLEILKKDSGALLQARDEKIQELKRRIDILEFNMELVQEQYEKERKSTDELKMKLRDAAQAMKQANGFLEQ
jgi:hypothetical protein